MAGVGGEAAGSDGGFGCKLADKPNRNWSEQVIVAKCYTFLGNSKS